MPDSMNDPPDVFGTESHMRWFAEGSPDIAMDQPPNSTMSQFVTSTFGSWCPVAAT